MLAIVAVVLVLAAALFGVWMQRRLFGGRHPEDAAAKFEGLPVAELVIPVRMLVALVLAFVLVQTFASYQDASDSAASEAGAVLAESDAATLLRPVQGAPIVGALRCYARSVAGPEWRSLEGSRTPSAATDAANARVTQALRLVEVTRPDPTAMTSVLDADRQRVEARRGRIEEAKPSVPGVVTALMIFGSVVVVAGIAAFAHPAVRPGMRLALIVATSLVVGATLVVIIDVDDPFGGLASVHPTSMHGAEKQMATSPYALGAPPCDASGRPIRA